jgi:hypothetical protein
MTRHVLPPLPKPHPHDLLISVTAIMVSTLKLQMIHLMMVQMP